LWYIFISKIVRHCPQQSPAPSSAFDCVDDSEAEAENEKDFLGPLDKTISLSSQLDALQLAIGYQDEDGSASTVVGSLPDVRVFLVHHGTY
jgi:hypothetical protein